MFLLKPRFGFISFFFSQSSKEKKEDCTQMYVTLSDLQTSSESLSWHIGPFLMLFPSTICHLASLVSIYALPGHLERFLLLFFSRMPLTFCFILMTPVHPLRPPQMSLLVWSLLWFYPGELLLFNAYPIAVSLFCFYTFPSGDFERPSRERRDCLT